MADTTRKGRCLCGLIEFEAAGEPNWVAHCHCESCRRATSAAFATYVGYPQAAVTWSGTGPARYRSSPGVMRSFCPRCGSPMSFEGERWPDEIHLFVASFEEPGQFQPKAHVHVEEQLPWIHLADSLKRFARTSREGPPIE